MRPAIEKQISSIHSEIRVGNEKEIFRIKRLFEMLKTGDPAADVELQLLLDIISRECYHSWPYFMNAERWAFLKKLVFEEEHVYTGGEISKTTVLALSKYFCLETINEKILPANHEEAIIEFLYDDHVNFEKLGLFADLSNLNVTPTFNRLMKAQSSFEKHETKISIGSVILASALLRKYGQGTEAFEDLFQFCLDLFDNFYDEQSNSSEYLINMMIIAKAPVSIVKAILEKIDAKGEELDRSKLALAILVSPEYREIYKILGPRNSVLNKLCLKMKLLFWLTPETFSDALMNGMELENYKKNMHVTLLSTFFHVGNNLKRTKLSDDVDSTKLMCLNGVLFLLSSFFTTFDQDLIWMLILLNGVMWVARDTSFSKYYSLSNSWKSFDTNKTWLKYVYKTKMDPKAVAKTILQSRIKFESPTDDVMVELIRLYFEIVDSPSAKEIYSIRSDDIKNALLYSPFMFFNSIVEYFKLIILERKPSPHLILGDATTKQFDYYAKWALNNVFSPDQRELYLTSENPDPLVLKYLNQ